MASSGVSIRGRTTGAPYDRVLTPDAVAFVAQLARSYGPRVDELLARRRVVQVRLFFFTFFFPFELLLLAPSLCFALRLSALLFFFSKRVN